MKLCAIESKELEEKILTRFAENQNDELLEDLSDYVINSQKEIERLNNIISELEKYLEKIIIDGGTTGGMIFWHRQVYDYLQELKGDNK